MENKKTKHPIKSKTRVFTQNGEEEVQRFQKLAERNTYVYTIILDSGNTAYLTNTIVFEFENELLDYEKKYLIDKSVKTEAAGGKSVESVLEKFIEGKAKDMVNHPAHYGGDNPMEVIKIINHYNLNFELGNVAKYVLRSDKKGNKLEDLKKAAWYLQHEIKKLENV